MNTITIDRAVVEQAPVAWQCRMRAKWGRSGGWWPWQECT